MKPIKERSQLRREVSKGGRIWEIRDGSKTALDAAQEFARTYWAAPRKINNYTPDGFFSVVRGLRIYRVFIDGDLWVVEVVKVEVE